MTQLHLKLNQPMAQGYLEGAAVATVRLLTDAGDKMPKKWWSQQRAVDISGGNGAQGNSAIFDLPAGGLYGVTIERPRGASIEREFFVKEGELRSEMIRLEVSPHEYLGWQQYAGIVRSDPYRRETITRSTGSRSTGNEWLDALMIQGQDRVDSLYIHAKTTPDVFGAKLPGSRAAWSMVHEATRGANQAWSRAMGPLNWPSRPDPEYAAWFPAMPDSSAGDALIGGLRNRSIVGDGLEQQFPRWVSFQSGTEIDVASIPWGWWGSSRDPDEEIRFVYDLIRPSPVDRESPGHVIITVQDRRWFGLLEFLASGQLQRADHIVSALLRREDPEAALHGKTKGPLIAVAGAIVLIARAATSEMQVWDRWLENLSTWFPGIPDGAILLGCRRLEQATNIDDLRKAHAHLRDGIDRGIPFFSACIRMLALALAQIGDEIPEADKDRRYIASVSTRVDPDQAFTVIRL